MAGIKSESVADFIPESVADFVRNQQIQVFFGDDIAITKDDSAGDRGPRVYGVRREFPTASSSLESAGSYALLVCCL